MRVSAVAVGVMAVFLGSGSVSAQAGIAQVRVSASVRMPEVLQLDAGGTHTIRVADEVVTRTTVYVTANRAWNLTALVSGEGVSQVRVEADARHGVRAHADATTASGRTGTRIPVVIEVRRPADAEPARLEWLLGAA